MKMQRAKFEKYKEAGGCSKMIFHLLKKYAYNHGERPSRVIGILAELVILFGLLYPIVGIQQTGSTVPITYWSQIQRAGNPALGILDAAKEGILFSLTTFTRVGGIGLQPANLLSQLFAIGESLTGALVALYFGVVLSRRINR